MMTTIPGLTLIPAGIPPVANVNISSAVKSGLRNTSTSKSLPQGRDLISSGASLTKVSYFALSCLSTIAVKPVTHSELHCRGYGDDPCTFPLSTTAVWVDVRLNVADIALDDWADVLDPVLGTLRVCVNRPGLEPDMRQ